ncbi:SPAG8 protein, partial [Atlantisia rogersi]|nr:SPAG8 protein [Atlantisia rogersi]
PAEQPSGLVPQGSCLIHNSQEERAMNHLEPVLGQEPGSEGFIHQHSHHRLLVHQLLSWPTNSTTMKDAYRPPHRVHLLGQGEPESPLPMPWVQGLLCSSVREEMLEEIHPHRMPMESVSTTHRDYCAGGYQSTPLPTSQPHNYCMDQPCTFWLEQARGLLGATSVSRGDSAFRRNAAFSTPITESLEQPVPCASLGRQHWPHKQ